MLACAQPLKRTQAPKILLLPLKAKGATILPLLKCTPVLTLLPSVANTTTSGHSFDMAAGSNRAFEPSVKLRSIIVNSSGNDGPPRSRKIEPSNESKNFSSSVTTAVPGGSPFGSGALISVPGKGLAFDEPMMKSMSATPTTRPTKPLMIGSRNLLIFLSLRIIAQAIESEMVLQPEQCHHSASCSARARARLSRPYQPASAPDSRQSCSSPSARQMYSRARSFECCSSP